MAAIFLGLNVLSASHIYRTWLSLCLQMSKHLMVLGHWYVQYWLKMNMILQCLWSLRIFYYKFGIIQMVILNMFSTIFNMAAISPVKLQPECHIMKECICSFNSLWPSDTIWHHWSRFILVQVMTCCLMAPSLYLNQCWLIINRFDCGTYLRLISLIWSNCYKLCAWIKVDSQWMARNRTTEVNISSNLHCQ